MRLLNRVGFSMTGALLTAGFFSAPINAGPPLRPRPLAGKLAARPAPQIRDDRFHTIGFTIPGAVFNLAVDINNRGMVGGFYDDAQGREFTFVWYRGVIESIAYPGADITNAGAITNHGLLFGNWGSETQQTAGWYDLTKRRWTALPPIDGKNIMLGWRMNSSGTAIGQACEGTFHMPETCVAWIWNGREYREFSVTNAAETVPQSINDRGQIVGLWLESPPFGYKAFLYDDGVVTQLIVNGGVSAVAYDVTNSGEVMMLAELDPLDYFKPVLYDRGVTTPLPLYPGAVQTLYLGTNERGDRVGLALTDTDFTSLILISLRK